MVIEAKASSNINYRNGRWYYNEKIPMCHDGPYRQADSSKWALKREIEDKIGMDFCKRCKMLHAVWFPLVNRRQIQNLKFHTDASSDITLGEEELENPTPFIESIYNHNVASIKTDINDVEKEKLFDEVLCPYCEIVEGYGTGRKRKERIFFKLLEAQKDQTVVPLDQRIDRVERKRVSRHKKIAIFANKEISSRYSVFDHRFDSMPG
jgi:hypothetical protein